ncbi:hypothetical protein C3489_12740 [Streptomyces sp. Ru71]|nr:hypothetical protein C3489_12740 [Streptomyces sp. Ru71]
MPLRPPVPPQRHDCPQLCGYGCRPRAAAAPVPVAATARSRVRREGTGWGVSARSGRHRQRHPCRGQWAGPRTDTPTPAPTHPPAGGATHATTRPQRAAAGI